MIHPARYQQAYVAAGRPPAATIHFAGPTDAFVAYFKLAAMGGVLLSLPVVFYQLWSFVAPGLYDREKKLALPFVGFSTIFFLLGSLFGYYLVFPFGYKWFLDFSGVIPGTVVQIQPTIMMEDYLGFTAQMLLAFGVVFEMPLFIFFLALGCVVPSRQLFAFGRYFVVLAFVLAAVLTPSTDIYSQVMLAAPLVALYFLAAVLAHFFGPKEARGFRQNLTKDTMSAAAVQQTEEDLRSIREEKEARLAEEKQRAWEREQTEEDPERQKIRAAKIAAAEAEAHRVKVIAAKEAEYAAMMQKKKPDGE